MARFVQSTLIVRLAALGILICCLSIVSRNAGRAQLASSETVVPNFRQTQSPVIVAEIQVGTPLAISAMHAIPSEPQDTDIAFTLTNVFGKTITALAIRQEVEAGGKRREIVLFHNLELTNLNLQPEQSMIDYSTYESLSEEQHHITLSVQYVRFSDGTTWGTDLAKWSERIAGQRAAAYILSKRLLKVLNNGNSGDVMRAIEAGIAKIEPPSAHSEEWNEGFRLACGSVVRRLKQAEAKGGWTRVDAELHQLAATFKGAQ